MAPRSPAPCPQDLNARDAVNRIAGRGGKKNPLELDPTNVWIAPNFKASTYKSNRRMMFFPDPGAPARPTWAAAAKEDPDPFADEGA